MIHMEGGPMNDRIPDMPDERTPSERLARIGKTAAEQAAWDRFSAGLVDYAVAKSKLVLGISECAGAFRNFADAWALAEARWDDECSDDIAAHADLAELNVQLDGYYA